MTLLSSLKKNIDWILFSSALLISSAGLVTMNSFTGESNFFSKQIIWIVLGCILFFILSFVDYHFLRRTSVVASIFAVACSLLILVLFVGYVSKGAQSWFRLGAFSIQPSDPAKIALIIVLAKYFTRRHIEIAYIKHIIVSGLYAGIVFILLLLEPDFGSALIIFFIWLGMVLVSGISKKHLLTVFLIATISFLGLWIYVFKDYQKQRIKTFIFPLADVRGAGYNAYQSTIAVGSGEILGKGIGYGTQSKLQFLPEHETDFIFAAFAEEWGFVGAIILFLLYGVLLWRIVHSAIEGASNFEILFTTGVGVMIIVHFTINVGMNVGVLPVTGVVLPLMSYGGSHILTEFAALGIINGMRRYRRPVHKGAIGNEILGV